MPGRAHYFFSRAAALAVLASLLTVSAFGPAQAQIGSDRYSSIVVDADSGNVLEADNPDALRRPASLAKLMTLYMTFEALRDRRITMSEQVPVSAHAASMQPTKLGLVPGSSLTVQEAVFALITKSANDAAAALAELLGGTEDGFAQTMTLRAHALGMSQTTFANASGLPDPDQWTTARDMAVLARHIVTDFPTDYSYFSIPSFVYEHRVIVNHDSMLESYPGADGMKTGYTEASGHNLVTSAVHSGVRLIGVVLGAGSNTERDIQMASLLDGGFGELDVPLEHRPVRVANRLGLIGVAQAAEVHPVVSKERRDIKDTKETLGPKARHVIQVGAFRTKKAARHAANAARRVTDTGDVKIEPVAAAHRLTAWRVQLIGLTRAEAQGTCAALSHHHVPCRLIRPDARQMASR